MSEELEGDENMGSEMAVEVERTQIGKVQGEKRAFVLAAVTISGFSGFVLNAECKTIPTL